MSLLSDARMHITFADDAETYQEELHEVNKAMDALEEYRGWLVGQIAEEEQA